MISHIITSACVIYLCCSTSADDFVTNPVIDMFDYLVFNNCWRVSTQFVFDSLFFSVFTWKSMLCTRSSEPCILLFEMNEDMATGCDTNPCISVVTFISSSGKWGLQKMYARFLSPKLRSRTMSILMNFFFFMWKISITGKRNLVILNQDF